MSAAAASGRAARSVVASLERVGSRQVEGLVPASGVEALRLGGGPVLPFPAHVREAAIAALDVPDAPRSSRGLVELRAAIADALKAESGREIDVEREILVTHGAMQALNVVLRATLSPGDEVVVPAPDFFFDGVIRLAGGVPVYVPSRDPSSWAPDLDAVEAALRGGARMVLFSNPTNPTGHLASAADLRRLVDVASETGALVVSDESYDRIVYSGETFSSILGAYRDDVTILVRSLSKGYALPNWRVGYVVASPALAEHMVAALEWECLHCGYVQQRVAAAAIEGPQQWLLDAFAQYERKRDAVFAAVADCEWLSCALPPSTPFLFLDVTALAGFAAAPEELLMRAGIPTVPGRCFGRADHVRLPFGADDTTIERLAAALRAFSPDRNGHES